MALKIFYSAIGLVLIIFACSVLSSNPDSNESEFDFGSDEQQTVDDLEEDFNWDSDGPTDDLGFGRFQYADILLMSSVPSPVNQWDYTLLRSTSSGHHIEENGREPMSKFTRKNFPNVKIIFTCAEGDQLRFYYSELDVPVIGVDAFNNDHLFKEYIDYIATIHGFADPTILWANFFEHPRAFSPVINRIHSAYGLYLENWLPRRFNNHDSDTTFQNEIGKEDWEV